jgi:hypothetical protein
MSQVIEVSVAAGSDDAEEARSNGKMYLDSSDLELINDADYIGLQTVGIRFDNLDIPPGATITAAWIEFTVDETDSVATSLTIKAQAADDAATFTSANFNVSSRPTTTASATWAPPAWTVIEQSGPAQQTVDLTAVVQEVVSRPGWDDGNAIAFIISGSGKRTAEAFESGASTAPVLHVEYTLSSNTPPVAAADTATTAEDTAVTVSVLTNDSDANGDPLTVTGVGQAAHGTAVVNANGTVTYTPAANFNGTDSFSYTISDGHGGAASATVSLNVTPVNDAPAAAPDTATTAEDVPVVIAVRANDSDVDGDTLTITAVGQPAHGTAVANANGTVTYTPGANFNGSDSFNYTVSDGHGGTASASVSVNVTPVNDVPTAAPDTANTAEDTPVTVAVLANDGDLDGDPLTVTAVGQPSHGTAVVNPNGTVTYTPAANFNGADSFSYTISDGHGGSAGGTVTVNVAPLNDAPTANPNSATTAAGSAVTIPVLANDTDIDGDPLSLVGVGAAANGIVVQNADGTVTYAPNPGFSGTDAFTYTISDGSGGTATGSVSVTVTPPQGTQVIEVAISAGSDDVEETRATGVVYKDSSDLELINDVEYVGLQTVGLRFDNLDIPPDAVITAAWIEFTVDETDTVATTLTIKAQASDDAPTFTSARFDVSSRPTTTSTVSWSPPAWTVVEQSGPAQQTSDLSALVQEVVSRPGWDEGNAIAFVITGTGKRTAEAFESGASTAAVLHVEYTVGGTNDPPVAVGDVARTVEDTSVVVATLTNDSDPDGNPLTVAGVAQPAHGTTVINPNGTVTYTPDAEWSGADSFTYTASDGQGGLANATVNITVAPVNDAPTAIDDLAVTDAETPVTIGVLVNDSDVESQTLTITGVSAAQNGTAVAQANGTILYTPDQGFAGIDSFTYTIADGAGGTDTATVTVHAGVGFGSVTFAVIGDYGVDNGYELAVSNLVKSLDPDFIVSLGDNAYGSGNSPDNAIGKYYSDYIGNYQGIYGDGSETNRFFPALGNHDWTDGGGIQAYLDFFTIPESSSGNERYYDFVMGPVQFFICDADPREPDGESEDSVQAQWLQEGLENSVTPWQVVVVHEPPYSSGVVHGPHEDFQWPYEEWGADAVFSGDEHSYERLLKDDNNDGVDLPYFVNGAGGAGLYPFSNSPDPDSAARYNANYGAMLVTASDDEITFEFWSIAGGGTLIDSYTIEAPPESAELIA